MTSETTAGSTPATPAQAGTAQDGAPPAEPAGSTPPASAQAGTAQDGAPPAKPASPAQDGAPPAEPASPAQDGASPAEPAGTAKGGARDFRPDIQGLRAIAVTLVVVYHLFPSVLPGGYTGVDVFFVISGFLITGHLWRTLGKTGRVSLADFWGRRARRLMPASALVLAVTWGASWLLLPSTRLADTATQIRASALYFQNWQLAHDAVDYLKSNDAASPVQHFWSLSVEEQFYLVWPLLFIIAAACARKFGAARRGAIVAGLTMTLVAASLAYSVIDTRADPAAAYFVTTTRMWELGAGGLLALLPAAAARRLSRQGWLGWAGLAAIIAAQFLVNGSTPFPGWAALLPVLGAAAMIAGGSREGRGGPWRLTSARPMVFLGGISYSLYLWHWPVIALYTAWRHAPGLISGPALAAASVLLAWLTKVIVEDRVRLAPVIARHAGRSLATALAAVVPAALATAFLLAQPAPWTGPLTLGAADPAHPGAAVLAGTVAAVKPAAIVPPLDQLTGDIPAYWSKDGCLDGEHVATMKTCTFGDTAHPVRTVALVGDSMAGNWWQPLEEIAVQEHWELITELHATCDFTATQLYDTVTKGAYPTCHAWGQAVLSYLERLRPDVVITSSFADMTTLAHPKPGSAARADVGAGEAQYWQALEQHGVPVVAVRETPTADFDWPACVAQHGASSATCTVPRSVAEDADPPTSYAAKALGGTVPVIDMNSLICAPASCSPVVGNVLVYFDSHHMTASYGATLAPYLRAKLLAASPVLRSAAG